MRRYALLPGFLLLLMGGCSSLQKAFFQTPKVTLEDVKISEFGFSGSTLLVTLAIHNPNGVGLTASALEYAVDVENERLLSGSKQEKITVKGKDISKVTFPVDLRYAGLRSGVQSVFGKKNLPYSIQIHTTLETPIGPLSFKINREGNVPIPAFPRFSVEQITLGEMSVNSATLNFHIRVDNNDEVALDLDNFYYRVEIGGQEVSAAKISVSHSLEKGRALNITLPVNLQLMNLRNSVVEIIRSEKISYAIDFNLNIQSRYGPFALPYSERAITPLFR